MLCLPLCDSYNSPFRGSWLLFDFRVFFQAKLIEELKVRSNADVLQAELKLIHGREKTMQLAAVKKNHTNDTPKRRIWSGLSLDANKKQHAIACDVPLYINMYTHYTYSSGGPSGIMHAFVRDCSTHYG